MSVFFTSDTHFGHNNIIKYCNRPFDSVEQMDEALISNWNRVVGPDDHVYHLGDFAYGRQVDGEAARKYKSRLNGAIHFIMGNHDDAICSAYLSSIEPLERFVMEPLYLERQIEGQKIVMCHYAMRTWHHDLRGTWHLYGHSHNGLPPLGKSVDVGVDRWDFTPVSFSELKGFMDRSPIHKAPAFPNYDPQQKEL